MIRAVIFDVGGVLIEYDTAANIQLLSKKLDTEYGVIERIWQELLVELRLGTISEEVFWEKASQKFLIRKAKPFEQLLKRTFQETMRPYEEITMFIESLKEKNMEVAILSDTIGPHAEALTEVGIYKPFVHKVLSHEVGMCKPDIKIFEYTLKLLNVKPYEAIFIDDLEKNITAARKAGIYGIIAASSAQMQDDVLRLIERQENKLSE